MSELTEPFAHLDVTDRAEDRAFHRHIPVVPRVRDVERNSHGHALRDDLDRSLSDAEHERELISDDELRAHGVTLVLQAEQDFPLDLDRLEKLSQHRTTPKLPQWLLLAVSPVTDDEPGLFQDRQWSCPAGQR